LINNFKASDSWLLLFKKKHRIVSRKITKFVSLVNLLNMDEITASANLFVENVKINLPRFHQDHVLNTDQSGFNYLLKSSRMLSKKGEKLTIASTESKNKQTHSYTIQPLVSLSAKLVGRLFICLQEKDGKFGPQVKKAVDAISRKCLNVKIVCSKSGKLQKNLVKLWANEVLYSGVEYKYLLLLDSWKGQTDGELFICENDRELECERMYIPENTTDTIQPLDVYGFRQWKTFVRQMSSHVVLDDIDIDLTVRDNIILMHSLIHNQLSAPIFQNMWKYSWFKSGYSVDKPPDFSNVKQALFEVIAEKCSEQNCDNCQFIRCAHCRNYLCFNHFFVLYHFHQMDVENDMEVI
jgi:hypothetical protein